MRTVPIFVCGLFLFAVVLVPNSFGQYSGVEKFRKPWNEIDERAAHLPALDFHVLSHRDWNRLGQSHAKNVLVHWPDGRRRKGLLHHIDDLKTLFSEAPDLRVGSHPVKFSSREWTCFIAELDGTFTRAMRTTDGRDIAPTGKHFKMRMCIVSHWNKRGLIDEEYLFWDNQSYLRQIGVPKIGRRE